MLPNWVRHDLIVKVLDQCLLDFIAIASFVFLEQVVVLDSLGPFIKKLRLLIIVLNRLSQSRKWILLIDRQAKDLINLILLVLKVDIDHLNTGVFFIKIHKVVEFLISVT